MCTGVCKDEVSSVWGEGELQLQLWQPMSTCEPLLRTGATSDDWSLVEKDHWFEKREEWHVCRKRGSPVPLPCDPLSS